MATSGDAVTGPPIEVRLLGPLEARRRGQVLDVGAGRQRSLLAILAIHANEVVSAERLVDTLWGEQPPEGAAHSLVVCVSALRGVLEPDRSQSSNGTLLRTQAPGYVLDLPEDALDADRFERLATEGRAALEAGNPGVAASVLRQALGLWRGPALGEFCDEDFARTEAARLEEARLVTLEARIDADLALGRHAQVVGEVEALVASEPPRERLTTQLMLALYRCGRQTEALRAYGRLRDVLGQELGIEPSPSAQALEQAILLQEPKLDWAQPRHPSEGRSALPTGVVTFLLTDIESSSGLWEAHPDAMADALIRHDELVEQVVDGCSGRFIKSKGEGDATLSVFTRASDAVRAAVELQDRLRAEQWPGSIGLSVRVGVHTGEAHERDGDYYGPTLNRAARLRALACGGQTLMSQATTELVWERLPRGMTIVDLGHHELRGLTRGEQVFELCGDGPPTGLGHGQRQFDGDRPAPHPWAVPLPCPLDTADRVAFVGRRQEMEVLAGHWAAAKQGRLRAVFIAGEPGVGKTRLVAEMAALAHAEGAVVLLGRCDDDAIAPYQPFIEVLEHYVAACPPEELADQVGPIGGELTRLVPQLTNRLSDLPDPLRADPETERYRLFEAVCVLLRAAARRNPVLLVLDDLHWADKPTLLLLRHVLRSLNESPIFILGTYRHSDLSGDRPLTELLGDLRRTTLLDERLSLRGLQEGDVSDLVTTWAGHGPPAAFARAMSQQTDGNPFFIEEILRHLDETGVAVPSDADHTGNGPSIDDIGLPEAVREVVDRRLGRLSEPCQGALTVASVVGQQFTVAVLERVLELDEDDVLKLLDEGVSAALVAEVPGDVGCYTFAHALVRQTFYERLSTMRRARVHARTAEVLEALYAADVEPHLAELAHHFGESVTLGAPERALDYTVRAAERAIELLAYEEAVEHYQGALQALQVLDGNGCRRLPVLMALGAAHRMAGDLGAAQETFLEAARLAREVGDGERLAQAALGAGSFEAWPGTAADEALMSVLDDALDGLSGTESALHARLLGRVASALYFDPGAQQRRDALTRRAVDMAKAVGDKAALTAVLMSRHLALWAPENLEERLAMASDVIWLAGGTGEHERGLEARLVLIQDLLEAGNQRAADDEIDAYEQLARELRQPVYIHYALLTRGLQAILHGRLEEGAQLAQEAHDLGEHAGNPQAGNYFGAQMWAVWTATGEHLALGDAVMAMIDDSVRETFPAARCGAALLACELGRHDDARHIVQGLADSDFAAIPRDSSWLPSVYMLSVACATLGDRAWAGALYDLVLPYAGRVAVAGPPPLACIGLISHGLGLLAAALGREQDAIAHFEAAIALAEAMDDRPSLARAQEAYGALLLSSGQDVAGRALLDAAAASASALGMKVLAERAHGR